MQVSVTFNTRALEDKLHELARYTKEDAGAIMREEAGQLARALIRVTPPSAGRKRQAKGGPPKVQAQIQGRNAASKDLANVFRSLPGVFVHIRDGMQFAGKEGFMAALTRASLSGDMESVKNLLTKPAGPETVQVAGHTKANGVAVAPYVQTRTSSRPAIPFLTPSTDFSGTLNPQIHTARRNSHGRTNKAPVSQIVSSKELDQYRKTIFDRVGWHMAGWVALAQAAGARAIPRFLLKSRMASESGTAQVSFSGRLFIRAVNRDVKIPGYQGIVDDEIAFRTKIIETKIKRAMSGRAVNLGFKKTAGR
jgi:hypothetical protein